MGKLGNSPSLPRNLLQWPVLCSLSRLLCYLRVYSSALFRALCLGSGSHPSVTSAFTLDTSWKMPARDSQFGRWSPEWTPDAHFLTGRGESCYMYLYEDMIASLWACPCPAVGLLELRICVLNFRMYYWVPSGSFYSALPTGLLLYVNCGMWQNIQA